MPRLAWLLSLSALLVAGCGDDDTRAGPRPAQEATPAPEAAPAPQAIRARPGETLAVKVLERVALRDSPRGRVVSHVDVQTEFDSDAVMAVMRVRGRWLGVHWPTLDNGELGWVRMSDRLRLLREPWKVRVDISERRATLLKRGRPFRSFPVAVGAGDTPTPPGRYGVTDRLSTGGPGSTYGCCVLAVSGRQPNVPQEWPGGDRLAIHGTSAPETIGSAASNGCLRASEESMRLLIRRVPLGAQVVIRE